MKCVILVVYIVGWLSDLVGIGYAAMAAWRAFRHRGDVTVDVPTTRAAGSAGPLGQADQWLWRQIVQEAQRVDVLEARVERDTEARQSAERPALIAGILLTIGVVANGAATIVWLYFL